MAGDGTAGTASEQVPRNGTGTSDASRDLFAGTAWATPGPAAYDFRSDTHTTPTASMLAAIAQTSLLDDVLLEDPTTSELEAFCASLLPTHPGPATTTTTESDTKASTSAGLLVLSGTMGNQVALRTHLGGPPHGVLGDHRAHIFAHEAGALCMISQTLPQPVEPSNGRYLTLADVQAAAVLDDDPHHAPTRLLALENTVLGSVIPLAEVRAMSDWARARGIAVHMDGARLWDAAVAAAAAGEAGGDARACLAAYARCADSVTVCFSKGLGAPVGSVLVGSTAWVRRARHVRKMLGGGMRMAGIVAAPARVAVQETFLGGRLARAHGLAARLAAAWTARGGRLALPTETGMLWLAVRASGVADGRFAAEAAREALKGYWDGPVLRVVCHYQIADDAVDRLIRVFDRVLADAKPVAAGEATVGGKADEKFTYGAAKKN